jgi:leucyl aminopeptidase
VQAIGNEVLESNLHVYDSILEARSIVNTAPNHMRPSDIVQAAQQIQGIKCTVLEGVEIKRMECLEAVGRGSTDKSKLITLEFMNDPEKKDSIALVGKGVTFDTGGYSLKPANSMKEMHSDMSGASVVIGIMSAISKLNLKVNVVGVIPCAENMISGDSMRPEDIYTSYSGQTVQVLNTDAEGRLILADAISYAQEKFSPKVLIDFATLTGAIVVALGSVFAGAYSNDDELFEIANKSGDKTGERIWRMPLAKEYSEMMDSKVADMKNISESSEGGSATAAAFLGRFVKENVKWLHLDIAGTSYEQKPTTFSTFGATGFGIRLILNALEDLI